MTVVVFSAVISTWAVIYTSDVSATTTPTAGSNSTASSDGSTSDGSTSEASTSEASTSETSTSETTPSTSTITSTACSLVPDGGSCTANSDCCSGNCDVGGTDLCVPAY